MFGVVFFFFKQKTAYEMRISDWSSDVCSSDLSGFERTWDPPGRLTSSGPCSPTSVMLLRTPPVAAVPTTPPVARRATLAASAPMPSWTVRTYVVAVLPFRLASRSEEHTSELKSLMRISYADFCLKKQNNTLTH